MISAGAIALLVSTDSVYEEKREEGAGTGEIASFAECVAAGYPTADSSGEVCTMPDGKKFAEDAKEESYGAISSPITIFGTFVCLPLKDINVPHNDICIFGLRDKDGNHYSLDNPDFGQNVLGTIRVDTEIRVEGLLTSASDDIYEKAGMIVVEKVDTAA